MTSMGPGSPRVIPPSPMSVDGQAVSSTAPSSATHPNPLYATLPHPHPYTHAQTHSQSQSQILPTPAPKGLAKTSKYFGKLSRPRSSNQVSGNSSGWASFNNHDRDRGDREQETGGGGIFSGSGSALGTSLGAAAFSSPGLGFSALDHQHSASSSALGEKDREKEREKEKERSSKARDLWSIQKQNSAERILGKDKDKEREKREREKEKEREREKEKDGKAKRSFSVRDGTSKALKRGKDKFIKGFDDALDFVDGK